MILRGVLELQKSEPQVSLLAISHLDQRVASASKEVANLPQECVMRNLSPTFNSGKPSTVSARCPIYPSQGLERNLLDKVATYLLFKKPKRVKTHISIGNKHQRNR